MAVNRIRIAARPAEVFDVLADGWTYADWVVGAKRVRSVDDGWPSVGAKIHHTVGVGPLSLDDNTEVIEAKPPHHLVLHARGRPLGKARVEMQLEPADGGTQVTMIENIVAHTGLIARGFDALIWLRNAETLRRLQRLAARRSARSAA